MEIKYEVHKIDTMHPMGYVYHNESDAINKTKELKKNDAFNNDFYVVKKHIGEKGHNLCVGVVYSTLKPCIGCKYYKGCGDINRTEPCVGRAQYGER